MNKDKSAIWRAIIGSVLGIVLVFLAIQTGNKIANSKAAPPSRNSDVKTKIYTLKVKNGSIPITIVETGTLQALESVELFSEVQGVLKHGNKLFRPGQYYKKGETILSIDDAEFDANIVSQRAQLFNLLTTMMPDLKFDYTEVYPKWQAYLDDFDIRAELPALPEFDNDQEKYFVNRSGILTSYYAIKNLEERLSKHTLTSPFYGTITEALVTPGALVRPGQKLGTIISPSKYELAVSVDLSLKDKVRVGNSVKLYNLSRQKSWNGRVARIDGTVDPATQGIQAYIEVVSKELKPGMFLEAHIDGKRIDSGYEISRKLLVDNDKVFVARGDSLSLTPVDIVHYKEQTAIISGMKDGTEILGRMIPGAYDGMSVEIVQ